MNEQQRWARATLRIASKSRAIDEITALLRLTPTDFAVKGSLASPRNPASKRRTHNIWLLDSGVGSEEPLPDHIVHLLADIEPRGHELEQLAGTCIVDLFLGYAPGNGPGKTTITHDLMRRLAQLPLSMTFDLMPPVGEKAGAKVMRPTKWSGGAVAVGDTALSTIEISARLGLESTWSNLGRPDSDSIDRFTSLGSERVAWILESGLARASPLKDHINALLDMLQPHADAVINLSRQALLELRLIFASQNGQGSLALNHGTVEQLVSVRVDLTIELTYPP